MIKKGVIFLLGFLCLMGTNLNEAKATHTAGFDIFYRHTKDSTYEVTVIFYRNCNGVGQPNSVILTSKSASIGQSYTTTLPIMAYTGSNVPPLKPKNMLNCTDATSLCYEEYVYRGNWTSRGRADDWILSTQICCRPGGAAAPANIAYGYSYIEAGLNNKDFPDATAKNWSPLFHNRRPNHPSPAPPNDTIINFLFRTLCENNFYTLDQSAVEYQGDSVSYSFYQPQGVNGAALNWNFASAPYYSLTHPLPTKNNRPLVINPVTGIIPVTPGTPLGTGIYVLGIQATEWRKDTIVSGGAFTTVMKQIGYVRRDMTIWIDPPSTCRKDSVHVKEQEYIKLSNDQHGDTILEVNFHNGVSGDPNSLVRCASLSPDGSEFRILDSTEYVAPYDSTVRSIGINRAEWVCRQGNTESVFLHLAEPLKCQDYTIMLKTGSDLDVLESECGFLEPEFSNSTITVTKDVQVSVDTSILMGETRKLLSYCLPDENAQPKLFANSQDSSSFPMEYFWTWNGLGGTPGPGDTIQGQDTPFMWATKEGRYELHVKDEFNCVGKDYLTVVRDTNPSFVFDLDPYCDKFGEQPGLPDVIWAPGADNPEITSWSWFNDLGPAGTGDTLRAPQLIDDQWYTLVGQKNPKVGGAKRCEYTYSFYYGRDSFPPQDPLWVSFLDRDIGLCETFGDTGVIQLWSDGVRTKYAPLSWQWYQDSMPRAGLYDTINVTEPGAYSIFMSDSLGCWDRDTAWVGTDVQLDGPIIPCTVRGGTGTFTFVWPDDVDVDANYVSLDGGITWERANGGYQHTVGNVEAQKFIQGKGLVSTACGETEISVSLECPDDVFPPNVITPNGDGLNDIFNIPGLDLFVNSELQVYDRWGNVVFSTSNYTNDWDGGDLAEGTYFYVLKVDDPEGTIHKGTLSILR